MATKSAPSLKAKLEKLCIHSQFDLVLHLPLRYEDETRITPIAQAREGAPVQVEGRVIESQIAYRPRRQLVCKIEDASGLLYMRFLNFYGSQAKALAPGALVRAFGEARPGFFGAEMVHPRYRIVRADTPLPEALTPIYPTTAGLPQAALRRLIGQALAQCELDETLPPEISGRFGMPAFRDAIDALHRPRPGDDARALTGRTHPAWRRMKLEELLAQQLSMRLHYRERKRKTAPALGRAGALTTGLLKHLPFRLTRAQSRAWAEIESDLGEAHPMHRLLQGDVGSGKTVVAALAALRAVENGLQAAVMAPTEILAEQHFRKFSEWLAPLGVQLTWLSGSQKKKQRAAAAADIASGVTRVAVGTHALFQEGIGFQSLGLAIVDEQHRFGVEQRLALRAKGLGKAGAGGGGAGGVEPHQLMMSATPIPRTLSMSYYADLDVSLIDELPPGRKPVTTKLIAAERRDEVLARVRDACRAGRQAYWVCPLIDDNGVAAEVPADQARAHGRRPGRRQAEALQLQTVLDTHARLAVEFADLRVGLVHGRLPGPDKAAVMAEFAAGKIQLLVATTVIEVGVDVSNASLMIIEHAERFGLAQLHQLRGRVGRGTDDSACILLYQKPLGDAARARLKVVYETGDGFEIARRDLLLRGPGEYLGVRQSGAPLLRFADLELDVDLLEAARDLAPQMLRLHPEQARRHLARWLAGKSELMKV
ncbi:MAG: ATP-dependent DNA helicase RecG [Betaproteobacteria bacterium RIFCSPLOWO2_12_FULL_64_23]|nr:MAG: ATP-dependent DNA helicase RecG [Betaproteobacteria bacterium RIFCSPLOWO2_12_FULL_64_23]